MTIASLVPNPDDLLALETEELAGMLLEYLNAIYPREPSPHTNIDHYASRKTGEITRWAIWKWK